MSLVAAAPAASTCREEAPVSQTETAGLLSSSIWVTFSRGLGVALQAAVILYLARALSVTDVGYFGLVYAFLGAIRFVGPLGTDQAAMREVALAKANRNLAGVQQASTTSLLIVAVVGTVCASATAITLSVAHRVVPFGGHEIAAIALSIPAFALIGLFVGQLRGLGYDLSAQLPDALGLHVIFGLLVLSLASTGLLDRASALISLGVAAWCVLAGYIAIRASIGVEWPLTTSPEHTIKMLQSGFRIFKALVATVLAVRAPAFLATALIGPAASAILEVAGRFGTAPLLVTGSVGATFSPRFARLSAGGDSAGIVRALRLSAILALVPAVAYLVLLGLGAPWAVGTLLPPAYADAYVPMLLVCLAATINAAFGLASSFLLMSGRERRVQLFSLAQLATVCVVSIVLAPRFGVVGIGWAMVVGALVRDGGLMLTVVTELRGVERGLLSTEPRPVYGAKRV